MVVLVGAAASVVVVSVATASDMVVLVGAGLVGVAGVPESQAASIMLLRSSSAPMSRHPVIVDFLFIAFLLLFWRVVEFLRYAKLENRPKA
jgi:hypothetical protein